MGNTRFQFIGNIGALTGSVVSNQRESVVFIPLDEKVSPQQLKRIYHPELTEKIKNCVHLGLDSIQLVLFVCERDHELVNELLEQMVSTYDLLVMNSDTVYFANGNFSNPRLEYRLMTQQTDLELLPNSAPLDPLSNLDEKSKSFLFQTLFHSLNRRWLGGEKRIPLVDLVRESIPFWNQYNRLERKRVMIGIGEELEMVFKIYFKNIFTLQLFQKRATSHPERVITIEENVGLTLTINSLIKKQTAALFYLKERVDQISIDELNVEL